MLGITIFFTPVTEENAPAPIETIVVPLIALGMTIFVSLPEYLVMEPAVLTVNAEAGVGSGVSFAGGESGGCLRRKQNTGQQRDAQH